MTAERCGMTHRDGAGMRVCNTPKFIPAPGAMAVCPRCDRRQCGRCKRPILNGAAVACVECGWDCRMTEQR